MVVRSVTAAPGPGLCARDGEVVTILPISGDEGSVLLALADKAGILNRSGVPE